MIVTEIRSWFCVSTVQLCGLFSATIRPFIALFRSIDAFADFGLVLLSRWDRQYSIIDAFTTKAVVTLILLVVVTKGLVACA